MCASGVSGGGLVGLPGDVKIAGVDIFFLMRDFPTYNVLHVSVGYRTPG